MDTTPPASPVTLQLQLSPAAIAELRSALRPSENDLELVAELVANRLQQEPDSYSVGEFARRLGVSASHVYKQIKRGRLRAVQPGGRGDRRILRTDASIYLAGATS